MKNSQTVKWICRTFTGMIFFIAASSFAGGNATVIANKDVPVESLSKAAIQSIFLGEKTRWENSMKIVFVILKEGETHNIFVENYLDTTPYKFLKYWRKQLFTGKGKMPKVFTEEEIVNYVAATEGAIGYVSPENADKDRVKIISVE